MSLSELGMVSTELPANYLRGTGMTLYLLNQGTLDKASSHCTPGLIFGHNFFQT